MLRIWGWKELKESLIKKKGKIRERKDEGSPISKFNVYSTLKLSQKPFSSKITETQSLQSTDKLVIISNQNFNNMDQDASDEIRISSEETKNKQEPFNRHRPFISRCPSISEHLTHSPQTITRTWETTYQNWKQYTICSSIRGTPVLLVCFLPQISLHIPISGPAPEPLKSED